MVPAGFRSPARTRAARPVTLRAPAAASRKPLDFQRDPASRTARGFPVSWGFALEDKGALLVEGRLRAHVLHAMLPVGAEEVEAQAVLLRIHVFNEPGPPGRPLGRVHDALEDRVLDPLAVVPAGLCDVPQAPPTLLVHGVHVI